MTPFSPILQPRFRKLLLVGVSVSSLLLLQQMGVFNLATQKPLVAPKNMLKHVSIPVMFEANKGQTAPQINFLARTGGYTMFFSPREMIFDFRSSSVPGGKHAEAKPVMDTGGNHVLHLQFVGANQHPVVAGDALLSSKTNYFIGNDPNKWHTNVSNYAKVTYQKIYPGIDMVFYGKNDRLEYDINVAPYADPNQAKFKFTGAEKLTLNKNGDLMVSMHAKETLQMHKPIVYQIIDGKKKVISGSFVKAANNEVSFRIGKYDTSKRLTIDPVLVFSTYLGGSEDNAGLGIAVDTAANPDPSTYITGYTKSPDFPMVNPYQATNKGPGRTAFVTKVNREGSAIIYSTYLGGSGGNDEGFAIAVDNNGSAYITGETNSKDFPLKTPFQDNNRGARDFSGFVTKLNPEGNALVYSTYLGGSGENQEGNGIAVDANGFAYVTGETTSTDFPLKDAFQSTNKGPKFTAYITKLNTLGTELVFSTYLGGSGGQDEGNAIAVDSDSEIYVTGETNSKDFPIANAIQPKPGPKGAGQTGFVTKMSADGQSLQFSTYFGGSGGNDYPTTISIDRTFSITIGGYTNSSDFPTFNALQPTNHAIGKDREFNGFITRLNSLGNNILFSTYLGGSGGDDRVLGLKVNRLLQTHVVGYSNSKDFPLLNPYQATNNGPDKTAFGARINHDGSLLSSSYFGGSGGDDEGMSIDVDPDLNSYATGKTNSPDIPLTNALQTTHPAKQMAFIVKAGA